MALRFQPNAADGSPERHGESIATEWRRKYDEEKIRVPSWCDRVLWRSLPGGFTLSATASTDVDDPSFYTSDHAPVSTIFERQAASRSSLTWYLRLMNW